MKYFLVDGVNILPYIKEKGIKWSRNDVDGKNAGRNLSADMIRDRLAIKIRMDIECRPLLSDDMEMMQKLIEPEFVTIQYDDPLFGKNISKIMYSNNVTATLGAVYDEETDMYEDLTFPLVQK